MTSPTTPSSLHSATLRQIETLSSRLTQQAAAAPGRSLVPITAIQPGHHQPRTQFNRRTLEELAASIKSHGIIEALILNRLPNGKYELVAGERRWRAAQLAGLTEVPADIRDYQDDDKLAVHAFISNLDREDLALGDEVREVARIVARYGDLKTAKEKIGKSTTWFSKRARLAEAPDFILAFMDSGRSRDVDGLYELTILAKDDLVRARQLLDSYIAADGTGPALRHLVRATQAVKPSRPHHRTPAPRPANDEPNPAPRPVDDGPDSSPVAKIPDASTPAPRPVNDEPDPAPRPVDDGPDSSPVAEIPDASTPTPTLELRPPPVLPRPTAPVTSLELSISSVHFEAQVLVLHTNVGLVHCRLSPAACALLVKHLPELQL